MVRKYITPGSVRIYGLPGTDHNFGIRDNGSGQMWSETQRVGSINYWTGDVVLDQKYVPRVRPWHALLTSLGLKREHQRQQVECEFEVSDLNLAPESQGSPTTDLTYSLIITGQKRGR
jgi:hypothetical protein